MSKRNTARKLLLLCAVLLAACIGACACYLGIYYHASDEAAAIADSETIRIGGHEVLLFLPDDHPGTDSSSAFVFYPGGKVQAQAYAPLCSALAERGIPCALVVMPFRLAVFGSGAAKDVITYLTDTLGCSTVCIGGHSLGGAMAAVYAASDAGRLDGIVLLGAYSTKDLTDAGLRVLSIYGSEDGVLSRERYAECLSNLPADFTELVIGGGCHSYFGDYGMQKGDGSPSIDREEQLTETADAIAAWMRRG